MSHSDRDQRSRPHSGKNCPESANGGCVYCITGDYKQAARRVERRGANVVIAEQIQDALAEPELDDISVTGDEHVYLAGRCVRCNVNWLDVGIYPGLEECPGKADDAPITFSTSTGEQPTMSHSALMPEEWDVPLDDVTDLTDTILDSDRIALS